MEELRRWSSFGPGPKLRSHSKTTQRMQPDDRGQSYKTGDKVQSLVTVGGDGIKENVTYRLSG